MRCKFTWTKIIGTILCLTGVIAMSFLQSPTTSSKLTYKVSLGDNNETEWIIGCGYLFISVAIISCITVLQVYEYAVKTNILSPELLCQSYNFKNSTHSCNFQYWECCIDKLEFRTQKSIIRTRKYKFTFTSLILFF